MNVNELLKKIPFAHSLDFLFTCSRLDMKFCTLRMQWWVSFLLLIIGSEASPNILLVVVDDVGFSDVGYNGGFIPTPSLDALAYRGVILENYYTHPVCTPSRAALMTGRYAHKVGLPGPLLGSSPFGLPETVSTLGEELQARGYATHLVGKWHLGFSKWSMTPPQRGFDTFLGIYGACVGHYTKYMWNFYDLRRGHAGFYDDTKTHSTPFLAEEAIRLIEEHGNAKRNGEGKPFFMFLSFLAAHAPLQAEPQHLEKCQHLHTKTRQKYCALVVGLDEAMANVTQTLREQGLEDTVIIFTTDNGGMPHEGGSPFPFRGTKLSAFEGGARGPAFVTAPDGYLGMRNYRYKGLFHIVDWFPTILYLADTEIHDVQNSSSYTPNVLKTLHGHCINTEDLDGVNMWPAIATNGTSPRTEAVITMDPYEKEYAIRVGDWKLILGDPHDAEWYDEPTHWTVPNATLIDKIIELAEDVAVYLQGEDKGYFWREILNHFRIRANRFLGRHTGPSESWTSTPLPEGTFLFNLAEDPRETKNLFDTRPDIVKKLKSRLEDLKKDMLTKRDWRRSVYRALINGTEAADPRYPDKMFIGPWLSEDVDLMQVETFDVYEVLIWRLRKLLRRSVIATIFVLIFIPGVIWRYWISKRKSDDTSKHASPSGENRSIGNEIHPIAARSRRTSTVR